MSNVYVSHRWVPGEKGQPPRRERVEYDRNQLLLASVRAGNVASDILTGLEDWQRQMGGLRRKRRKALGPGHPMRIEDRGEEDDVTHALASDGSGRALCGVDESSMAGLLVPASVTGAPTHELMFEDSNRRYHCTTCRTAADL